MALTITHLHRRPASASDITLFTSEARPRMVMSICRVEDFCAPFRFIHLTPHQAPQHNRLTT